MADPVTPEELALWHFEYEQIDTPLRQIEEEERKILKAEGVVPPDEVGAFAFLNPDVPKAASREQRTRVREAMVVLALIKQTRTHLALGGNPSRAAQAALFVGLHANEATARAVLRTLRQQQSRKGGTVRGRALASEAARRDATIRRHYAAWLSSANLQSTYRTPTPYIVKKTSLNSRTVRRRLKLLVGQ